MKKSLLILFIFVFVNVGYCQWVQVGTVPTTQLNAVKFFDQYTGVTAGAGGIWRTTNGGYNWTQVLNSVTLYGVSFSDVNNGCAVGDSGKIYRTNNNGLIWFQQNSPTTLTLYSVALTNSYWGHALGQSGVYLRTFNSGSSWAVTTYFNYGDFFDIKFLDETHGYCAGTSAGEICRSTMDGGDLWISWLNVTSSIYHLHSVAPISTSVQVCAGDNGRIRRTTNGGANWTIPVSGVTSNLNSITFSDANNGWICGDGGVILRSTNGGVNWTQQNSSTSNNLRSLTFINNLTGWSVGYGGIVLRTGVTGIDPVSNEIPKEFKLYQNYPNPFNSSTRIKFQNSKHGAVKLTIYDIVGRDAATLINEELKPGIYEIEWEASSYPSGVYYYRLETGNFFETRKVVLLK